MSGQRNYGMVTFWTRDNKKIFKEKPLSFLFLLHATIHRFKWRVIQMAKHETCLWQMLTMYYGCPCHAIHSFQNKWHCCDSVAAISQKNPTRQGNWPQMGWCFCYKALDSKSRHLSFFFENPRCSAAQLIWPVFTKSCLMGPQLTLGLNSE